MKNDFVAERKEIGKGRQTTVYEWRGFAYKVFCDDGSRARIDYEIRVQNELLKTSLPVIKFYPSEFDGTIKMDYINGITLGDKILKQHYQSGVEDLLYLQEQIHCVKGLHLPAVKDLIMRKIIMSNACPEEKNKMERCLSEIENGESLCHLDFHPYNVIEKSGRFFIIDWANAGNGNPIYDYVRTYIILDEHDHSFSHRYREQLKQESEIDNDQFEKALYLMTFLRGQELRQSFL